jgi:hypothetical protein
MQIELSGAMPIVVLPWIELDAPVAIGGVRFAYLEDLAQAFSRKEYRRAEALLNCFGVPAGTWRGGRASIHRARPVIGVLDFTKKLIVINSAMDIDARLDLSSFALAALALQDNEGLSAEAVTPFKLEVTEANPRAPLKIPYPSGGNMISEPRNFVITRQQWGALTTRVVPDVGMCEAIDDLVDQAAAGIRRARKTLTSLKWFVLSHDYAPHISQAPNLVALGTAFELLFDLVDIPSKTDSLRSRVRALTGSRTLERAAGDFYRVRSAVAHGEEKIDHLLPDRHITWLNYGWQLFWLCFRATLEDEHGISWTRAGDRLEASRDRRVEQLECLQRSNQSRVLELLSLLLGKDGVRKSQREKFIRLLIAMQPPAIDQSVSPAMAEDAVRHGLRVLEAMVTEEGRARREPSESGESLGRMSTQVANLLTHEHVSASELRSLGEAWSTTEEGGRITLLTIPGRGDGLEGLYPTHWNAAQILLQRRLLAGLAEMTRR